MGDDVGQAGQAVPPGPAGVDDHAVGRAVREARRGVHPRVAVGVAHDQPDRRVRRGGEGRTGRPCGEPDGLAGRATAPGGGRHARRGVVADRDVGRHELDDERGARAVGRRVPAARPARGRGGRAGQPSPAAVAGGRSGCRTPAPQRVAQRRRRRHPGRGVGEPLLGSRPVPPRRRRARSPRATVVCVGESAADAERVDPGQQRPGRRPRRCPAVDGDGPHLQRVGDISAVEAEVVAQQPGHHGGREGRRAVRSSAGTSMCALITALPPRRRARPGTARVAGCRRGRSTSIARQRRGASRRRCRRVRGSAWRRRRRRPTAALDAGGGVPGDQRGVGAEGAHADDRVAGVGVDVGDGRAVEVDPARGEPAAQSRAATARVRSEVVDTPSARLPGKEEPVAASSRVTSPPSSSMATSTSGRAARSRAVSAASCSGDVDVAGEQATAAEPSSSRRSSQSGAVVPAKPGCSDGERVAGVR